MKDWDYENEQWTRLPDHLKHLPLFTRHLDLFSMAVRAVWAVILKVFFFRFYIYLKVEGDYGPVYKNYPRLLIISNHASHLDAVSIAASIPTQYWINLYIAAAKDYFFTNPVFTFFSQHCLGAIPIDRKDKRGEAIRLITTLLSELPRMWLILFPEGTRSKDGKIHDFKRGVAIFAERTQTPILFLYLEGNGALWPKGAPFARPGKLVIHVGPVKQPAPIEEIYADYKQWVVGINPHAFDDAENADWKPYVPQELSTQSEFEEDREAETDQDREDPPDLDGIQKM
ncbi:MAG: lysophospholipid acyltransferase family protein [Bdellovibrio sp.]|jgi:1-acyl-sn-glycerol-3-phosphate acyltransferase